MLKRKKNTINLIRYQRIIENVAPFENLTITNMVLLLAEYSLRAEIETRICLIQWLSMKGRRDEDSKLIRSFRELMART